MSVKLDMEVERESDLIGVEEKKSRLWDIMKMALSNQDQGVILTRKGDEFILISRVTNEQTNAKAYWQSMYQQVQKKSPKLKCHLVMFIWVLADVPNGWKITILRTNKPFKPRT